MSCIEDDGILACRTIIRTAFEHVGGGQGVGPQRTDGDRQILWKDRGKGRNVLSADAAALTLAENLHRSDLHYIEEAEGILRLIAQCGLSQNEAAALLAMSPSALCNKLRLLRLSPACRALLVEHGLTERHARCLLRLEDEGERLTALRQAAAKHWNVAQTEQYVERRLAALQTAPPAGRRTYIIKDVRLFLNSVDRGLRLIRDAGVDARTEREETEDEIVLTLRIPKQRRKEA